MSHLRLFLHAALAVLLGVLVAPTALAQDPTPATEDTDAGGLIGAVTDLADPLVRIKATQVGDGLVRDSEWAALHVRLANLGEPLVGELIVETRSGEGETLTYRRSVELPAGAKKNVRFLYKPGIGGTTRRIDFLAGRRSVAAEIPIRWVGENDVAIGVIGEDAAGLPVLRSTWSGRVPARAPMPQIDSYGSSERQVMVGLIPPAQVPDRANGLDVFNWLVWVDADPSKLSPEQAAAIRAWVAGGGHLALTVTERWRQVGQGPLGDMLPVELSGIRDGHGGDRLLGRGARDVAPQAIAQPRPRDGRRLEVLTEDEGDAVWTIGTYGLGTVHVLTVDPRMEPIKSGLDRETLWRQLLWLPPSGSGPAWFYSRPSAVAGLGNLDSQDRLPAADMRLHPELLAAMDLTAAPLHVGHGGYGGSEHEDVFGATDSTWMAVAVSFLKDIPGVAPIPMEWLLVFASIYLLVIGPLDYFVLRALKRQTLTWITFPVSIAVFSGLALVGTSYVKGSQAVVTRYEIVDVLPGTGLWRGTSWYGVWSTRGTALTMTSGEGDGVTEFVEGYKKSMETVHGTAGSALGWTTDTWTLAYVRTTWTAPKLGGFSATPLGDGSIELRNDSGLDLTDVAVDIGNRRSSFDSFPAGSTLRVQATSGSSNLSVEPYRDEELELADYRPWAVTNAVDMPEVRRGHIDWGEWDVLIVGATTGPIEDSVLEGLTPNPRTLTVVRAPLTLANP